MQIRIKYVNFPKPGGSGKYGSIVDQSGAKIMVPADMLDLFRANQTVEISTKEQTWYRGTPDEAVVTIATSGPTGAVQGQGGQAGYQRPSQGQGFQRSNTGFQPRVVEGGRGKDQWTPEQTRWNFIMGIAGRAMGSGKFTVSEIRVLTQEAAAAYDLISKPAVRQPPPTEPPPIREEWPGNPHDLDDPGPELQ